MGKYDPGKGPYEIRYGMMSPEVVEDTVDTQAYHYKRQTKAFDFYTKLQASVLDEGFRNPIMIYVRGGSNSVPYGGSRLHMAHKLSLVIPALISDWTGEFEHWELITTIDQALDKFLDLPACMEFHPTLGCNFWGCTQMQLSTKDTEQMDGYTRKTMTVHLANERLYTGQYWYAHLGVQNNGEGEFPIERGK